MLTGRQAVTANLKVIVDPAVVAEETLSVTGSLETLHLSFASPCRLVRRLGAAIGQIGAEFLAADPGAFVGAHDGHTHFRRTALTISWPALPRLDGSPSV
jgi:hypothetical protein